MFWLLKDSVSEKLVISRKLNLTVPLYIDRYWQMLKVVYLKVTFGNDGN